MKVELFVVAFCLLFAGAYFTYTKHTGARRNESKIVINSDNDHEEINHAGKIVFSDDEKTIESISPGGYLFYRKNEESFSAESDGNGVISYTQYDRKDKMPLDSNGRKLVADAIHEIIAWGFDGKERMERLYKKGGNAVLIDEIKNLKNEDTKRMYLEHMLFPDSVSSGDLTRLLDLVRTSVNDEEKSQLLKKINPVKLRDTAVSRAYLAVVESDNNDYERGLLLKDVLDKFTYNKDQLEHIMDMIAGRGNDPDKDQLISALINKKEVRDDFFDKLVDMISHINDDVEKENLFKKLVNAGELSEIQWTGLLGESVKFGSDVDKCNLLLQFAHKMPKTECLKSTYLSAAKTISDDGEYGKAVRAVE